MLEDVLVRLEGGKGTDLNSELLLKPVFLKETLCKLETQ